MGYSTGHILGDLLSDSVGDIDTECTSRRMSMSPPDLTRSNYGDSLLIIRAFHYFITVAQSVAYITALEAAALPTLQL